MDGRTARAVLGVAEHTSADDLRRAYRRHLHAAHPDHGGSRQAFDAVRTAFAALAAGLPADAHRPADPGPGSRGASPGPIALRAEHGFCAYDSPPEWRADPRRDFADVLAAAMARAAA